MFVRRTGGLESSAQEFDPMISISRAAASVAASHSLRSAVNSPVGEPSTTTAGTPEANRPRPVGGIGSPLSRSTVLARSRLQGLRCSLSARPPSAWLVLAHRSVSSARALRRSTSRFPLLWERA